ncbi:MAG: UbiX family flavin prenyltransferase [Candidatus Diapherotrites archaeon]|nr:UbiX family flavin prenyltransferase [Candidatus Diapherotrites archaeon]
MNNKLIVAISGASGFQLGFELLKSLKEKGIETHLIISDAAQKVRQYETKISDEELVKYADFTYKPEDIHTKICSSSFGVDGMVIIPCSMNTLGHIANGLEKNAITRAANNQLKSERKLILVLRETPLTLPQLKNMVKAKEAGCTILPAMMCHYIKPQSFNDMEKFIVGRTLELLDIEHEEYKRWDVYE